MFAAVCVLLAAVGHTLMSGHLVPGRTLVLAFASTSAIAWLLAGRERGLLAVTTTAVTVQTALHTVFSWSQQTGILPANRPRPAMDHSHMAYGAMGHGAVQHMAMDHEAVVRVGTAMTETPTAHDMTDLPTSLGMLSAHLLAALLSGLWMAYGERGVFRVLRALPLRLFRPLRLLFAAVVPVPAPRSRVRPCRTGDERAPRRLLLTHSVISRGPPQAIAVL
ncbi:hypothetical protein GT043_15000 [Streptomyces sp. SID2131]|nr:hypothetical protein [Streptomyces sp. SID2131]